MNRLEQFLIATGILVAFSAFAEKRSETGKLPHVVFILADDMGYGDVGCYNPKSRVPTPSLDRLAREGVRFTDAHSGGSSCIPSRYALMTGRFAVRKPMSLNKGPLIEPERMTIASLLRDNGYHTAMVGKWHLGFDPFLQDRKNTPDYSRPLRGGPADCGFESFFGMHASLDIPPYFYIRGRSPVLPPSRDVSASDSLDGPEGWNNIQGAFWREGKIAPNLKFDEVTPRFFEEAAEVIRGQRRSGERKPLFLYLALPSPHTPWLPLSPFHGKSGAGLYGDFVVQVDAGIGRLMAALQAEGMDQDTLVLFSSDNGPVWYQKDIDRFGHDAVGGLRGMKFSSWEGGHRMPFIARWPRRVPASQTSSQPIAFSDVFATLAEIVGHPKPPAGMAEDSHSFLSQLLRPDQPNTPRPPIIHDRWTIRDGDWKLIQPKRRTKGEKGDHGELYNLRDDQGEMTNLITTRPEIAERLRKRLSDFFSN